MVAVGEKKREDSISSFLWLDWNCSSPTVRLTPWGEVLTLDSRVDLHLTSEIEWPCPPLDMFWIEWILLRCSPICSERISLSSTDRETFVLPSGIVPEGRYELLFSLLVDGNERENLTSVLIDISSSNPFLTALQANLTTIFALNDVDLHIDLLDRPVSRSSFSLSLIDSIGF